ncbi:PPOX class F420-dependent oxidoreductase [Dactylosporangium sp. NPDC049525]|uniref:PPOX class F420-dependent oxidoreductase n=1 Tax=Dactylosporangium sp. NPDC049525 TaxID=3154730 RepID=UPI0034425EB8
MTHAHPTATVALGAQRFVSLTTFKKDGSAVATPVWVAQSGDVLVVTTPAESYKVKRLRRDPRVLLVPCGRTGKVAEGERPVEGTAEIVTDPAEVDRMTRLVRRKYGLEYRVTMLVERVVARGRRPRVILRIALSE